ncbi:helix-turn-helix domain-containing protein [Sciscionella marina]|uniref:helix-turn-helix domain-containing protein n=1 Tax=Sciscionella marina TaxID=508770 RepID=UPI0003A68D53|nr:XRE family transcriptional regulator [Sciscionella marina]
MSAQADALAENLRRLRETHGLSLADLSARCGVAKATLFKIERAGTNPTLDTLIAIAETFAVTVPSLITVPEGPAVEVLRAGEGEDISDEASTGQVLRSQVIGAGTLEIHAQTFHEGKVETSPSHGAGSREHIVVKQGTIEVGPVGYEVTLSDGDYATYPADRTHRWQAVHGDARVWIFHTFPRAAPFAE